MIPFHLSFSTFSRPFTLSALIRGGRGRRGSTMAVPDMLVQLILAIILGPKPAPCNRAAKDPGVGLMLLSVALEIGLATEILMAHSASWAWSSLRVGNFGDEAVTTVSQGCRVGVSRWCLCLRLGVADIGSG